MGKGKQVKNKYSFPDAFAGMIGELLVMEVLLCGFLYFLKSGFANWSVGRKGFMMLQVLLLIALAAILLWRIVGGRLIRILTLVGYVAAVGIYARIHVLQLIQNGKQLFDDYIVFWNKQFGTSYQPYKVSGQNGVYALTFLVAVCFISCVFLYGLTAKKFVLLLPSLFVLSGELWVNIHPDWMSLAVLFAGILILYALPEKRSQNLWKREQQSQKNAGKLILVQGVHLITVAGLGVLILLFSRQAFGGIARQIPGISPAFQSFQTNLEQYVKNLDLKNLFSDKLNTKLNNATPRYSGKEIFTVRTQSMPQSNLYFKEFASGTYENGEWQGEGSLFEKEAEKKGIDPSGFSSKLEQQVYKSSRSQGDMMYSISYTESGRDTALTPYFTAMESSDLWMNQDNYMKKKKGTQSLEVKGLRGNVLTAESFSNAESDSKEFEWYNAFAREHYQKGSKDVPAADDYASLILSASDDTDDAALSNDDRLKLASDVAEMLKNKAKYNLYLDKIPGNVDATQYFLETSREGYCMHFASAATLILQDIGIPARYASGYIAKTGMFHSEDGYYEAKIPDRNAHAWVEVYLDNVGWIPVEVTPGYASEAQTLPTDQKKQEELKREHESKAESVSDTQQQTTTQAQTETQTRSTTTEQLTQSQQDTHQSQTAPDGISDQNQSNAKGKDTNFRIVLIIAGGAAGVVLLVWIIIRIRRKYQIVLKKEIEKHLNRKAVCRINQRLYRKQQKHFKGSRTDTQYVQNLKKMYPDILADDWEKYLEIVQKAVFSKEKISEEEVQFCYQIYLQTRRTAKRGYSV